MKKINKPLVVLTTLFGSLMIVFLCLFLSFFATSKEYKTQLENSYMKSFYEMVDNVNDLEVSLSKIVATNNISSQRELLASIYDTCMIGVGNLNVLPINNNKLTEINKLLNTTGGFAYSLLLNNYEGNLISNQDYAQFEDIYDSVLSLRYDINSYMQNLQYDYSILDDVDFGNVENSSFSAGFVDSESSSANVPSLIYDGPFSDSLLNKEIVGLGDVEYYREQVEQDLASVFAGKEIKYTGETNGKFQTYNFEVIGDVNLYVSVTKKGGFILSITAFGSGEGVAIDTNQGIEIAESFAEDIGIDNMYSVWYQKTGNMLYVNLAPIVNKVIYYSDLVKVKVDLSLCEVVGWEATNYATNHVSDRTFTSSVGLLDALANINPLLEVQERNLCIIPDKYVGELSAYEFICTWENYTYYIYIDANSGEEVNIMRVINTSNGNLLI